MPPTLLQLKMKRIILILKNYGKYTKNISFQKLIVVLWSSISTLRMNVLYEESLQAFESKVMSSQTLLFPEEIEFSKDEYDILLEIFPYLKKLDLK